jgi:hypothetical protein
MRDILDDHRLLPMVGLVARQFMLDDGPRWRVQTQDFILIVRAAKKPLTESAHALLRLEFDPRTILSITPAVVFHAYCSVNTALTGRLWEIVKDHALVAKWESDHRFEKKPRVLSLRDRMGWSSPIEAPDCSVEEARAQSLLARA